MFGNLFDPADFQDYDPQGDVTIDENDHAKRLYVEGVLYLRHLVQHYKPDGDEWIALMELVNILEAATIWRNDMSTTWSDGRPVLQVKRIKGFVDVQEIPDEWEILQELVWNYDPPPGWQLSLTATPNGPVGRSLTGRFHRSSKPPRQCWRRGRSAWRVR